MKFLKTLFNVAKAKDAEAAEALEDANAMSLAKQDVAKMQEQLAEVTKNLGSIKGRVKGLERGITEKKQMMKDDEHKALQLLEASKEDLAQQVAARIESTKAEMESEQILIKQQKDLCSKHDANKAKLQQAIQDCESELKMMKTMNEVNKSNEALTVVNTSGAESARSKFQARREKMQAKLDTSSSILEEQESGAPGNLDNEVEAALGKSKGSDTLAALKAKMNK